jgi:hypothetical protein
VRTEKKFWRPSPAVITLTTAVAVIAMTMLIGWLNARRYRVNARVEIGGPIAVNEEPTSLAPTTSLPPDGEVARLAERIREATGLLMGLTVLAVTEQMNNRSLANTDGLIALMSQHRLFPPQVNTTSTKGVLASSRATICLRYRAQPLGIEIVSVGRNALDGPAVIVRMDASGTDDSGAVLLVAKRRENVALPEAFTPLSKMTSLNWSIEPLRERSFDPQEVDQLHRWTAQHAANGK